MRLIIRPEYTGLDNYGDERNCPIARALQDKGYDEVRVGAKVWQGVRKYRFLGIHWQHHYIGRVSTIANIVAKNVAYNSQMEDIVIHVTRKL